MTQDWGYVYDSIRIFSATGYGFGSTKGTVEYGAITIPASSVTWSDSYLEFTMPRNVGTDYISAGAANIKVTNANGNDSRSFTVRPSISSINPSSGEAGTQNVRLDGFAYGTTGSTVIVKFDGTNISPSPTSVRDLGSDYLTFNVPSGATTGVKNITVEVNSQVSNTMTFEVKTPSTPVITKLQVKVSGTYQDTTEAIVYDTIRIVGTGFGTDPGDGSRDSATYNVTLAGNTIYDGVGTTNIEVYSWSATAIEFGIPRRVGTTFINAGANAVVVTANGKTSSSYSLNIKPHIYGILPSSGYADGKAIATIEGTALEGSRTIKFDSYSAGSGTISRQNGNDPDGTSGTDSVTVIVPSGPTVGTKAAVSATISSLTSNNDVTYTVIDGLAPMITQIIPNSAPNSAEVKGVVIKGANFNTGVTVTLKKTGQTDITGTVTSVESTKITVNLPITGKTVGKWNVVVTNTDTKSATKSKGFTISDANDPYNETSQILDDFEGVAVTYPGGYTYFPSSSAITLTIETTGVYEGDQSGSVTYPLTALGYRGYDGSESTMQDISNFTTIYVLVKGNASNDSSEKVKVQITDVSGKNFAAVDALGNPKVSIPVNVATWTKYKMQLTDFVEVGSTGLPVAGGATLNKAGITDYQLIFTGNAAASGKIYLDLVAAGGYKGTSETSAITTTITRAADTVGSAVTISWKYNDSYTGNADIYTISGSWDASAGVFTTEASKWTKELSNVASPQTDNTQVGQGTQKYYKVVKTGTALTSDMLKTDVGGKFDLAVGPSDTQPERALISLPLQTSGMSLETVFGSQPVDNDAIAIINNSFAITSGRIYSGGVWTDIGGTITSLTEMSQGYSYVYTALASKYMTIVGKVRETDSNRTIVGGQVSGEAALSWIANSFPTPALISESKTGLNGLSAGADATIGAQSALIDANAAIIGNAAGYALHNAAATWVDTNSATATLTLMPGRGYMLTEPTITSYSWTQSR